MEFKTILMAGTAAAAFINIARQAAKSAVVDAIGIIGALIMFVAFFIVAFFVCDDSTIIWSMLFGYWVCAAIWKNGDDC